MKVGYKPYHFKPYELVPKDIYKQYGDLSLRFLDDRILKAGDRLRSKYGVATINDWYWGGEYDSRGFRPPNDPDGAFLSAHKRGQALDIVFKNVSAAKVRRDIFRNPNKRENEFINLVETNISWLHISCENVQRIETVNPKS